MTFSRFFVVGGAGFIGSHLVDALVERGPVTIFDDLSTGHRDNVARPLETDRARLIHGSAFELEALANSMERHDVVFLCAEPTAADDRTYLERHIAITNNVLEAMRRSGARRLVFPSTGEVYGSTCSYCSENDLGDLPRTSYGAAKLACEAIISGHVGFGDLRAWIFRIGEVVGARAKSGPVVDVITALASGRDLVPGEDPDRSWPFVHVSDCVCAMLFAFDRATGPLEVFNLAPVDYTSFRRMVELCSAHTRFGRRSLRFEPSGNAPHRRLDASKLDALGWELSRTSDAAVRDALAEMSQSNGESRREPRVMEVRS